MKKLIAIIIFATSFILNGYSQIEYFGDNDVWSLEASDIEVYNEAISVYFKLDMNKTSWSGFNPKKEGLLGIGLMIDFDFETGAGSLLFVYNSEFELSLGNWVLIYNEANNAYLLGGQLTNGDTFHSEKLRDGTYIVATEIFFGQNWVQWFVNNAGGYYKIAIMEYNYGDNLIFTLPEELFKKINEIYYEYYKVDRENDI